MVWLALMNELQEGEIYGQRVTCVSENGERGVIDAPQETDATAVSAEIDDRQAIGATADYEVTYGQRANENDCDG